MHLRHVAIMLVPLAVACRTPSPDTESGESDTESGEPWCDADTLVRPDGSTTDCLENDQYCGFAADSGAACLTPAGGGANEADSPAFLTHPLEAGTAVKNGWTYNFAGNGASLHHGAIDFEAAEGTSAHAACDGVAMKTAQPTTGFGYGNFVQIHCDQLDPSGNHYHLIYAHVQRAASGIVEYSEADRRNQDYGSWTRVVRGDLVAYTGSEDTSWAHLHFEVNTGQYKGTPILDPYDIYAPTTSATASAEQEYPPAGTRFDGCGDNFLWATCPPMPAASSSCEGDQDGDGYGSGDDCLGPDCDDEHSTVHSGAAELTDYLDNDCDGSIDENARIRLDRIYYSNGLGCTNEAADWDHCFSAGSSTCVGSGQGGGSSFEADPGRAIVVYGPEIGVGDTVDVGGHTLAALHSCYHAGVREHWYGPRTRTGASR